MTQVTSKAAADILQLSARQANKAANPIAKPAQANDSASDDSFAGQLAEQGESSAESGKTLPTEATQGDAEETATTAEESLNAGADEENPEQLDALFVAAGFVIETVPEKSLSVDAGSEGELTGGAKTARLELADLSQKSLEQRSGKGELTGEAGSANFKELIASLKPDTGQSMSMHSTSESVASRLPAVATTELTVPVKVTEPAWQEGVGGRLSFMVNQKISIARIHINPQDLGPIEVKVNLNHDQASVHFLSHSAQVRDALESSIPRLREMLEAEGFGLLDAQVSDQSSGRDQPNQDTPQYRDPQAVLEEPEIFRQANGVIDFYA